MIQIYTGDGKGKTTAALGQCFRAAGHGLKSIVFTFMKGFIEYGELKAAEATKGMITIIQCGRASFVSKENPDPIDVGMAVEGFSQARQAVLEGTYDIIVLDEICVAIDFRLIALADVVALLKRIPAGREVILTGRYCPRELAEMADLVSEMREVKHYYQRGVQAREGFEF